MKIVIAASVVFGLCSALSASAAPAPAAKVLDLTGTFVRVGNLWFDPIIDEDGGKPIQPVKGINPDTDNIYAGDSDNPILQPWAREIVKRNADSEIALKHVYTADDACWPSGVPQAVNLIGEVQFLQARDHITIIYQRDHQVRWIWLNGAHSPNPALSWYGESVGHFEGEDTLVVDTIRQKQHKMSVVDPFGTPHTDQIHVVERYQLFATPFGKGLFVTVEVTDPGAFTTPWKGTAEYRQERDVVQIEENICAENNRTFGEGATFGEIPQERTPPF